MSHYDWLETHIEPFFRSLAYLPYRANKGFIAAHGDKCYGYQSKWEDAGIPFEHGVAIYFLTYLDPYSDEVRETKNGWVPVDQWVIDNYERFKPHLDRVELNEKILDAETRCSQWLADGNENAEQGDRAQAERCYEKSQYWLDRANKLRGLS